MNKTIHQLDDWEILRNGPSRRPGNTTLDEIRDLLWLPLIHCFKSHGCCWKSPCSICPGMRSQSLHWSVATPPSDSNDFTPQGVTSWAHHYSRHQKRLWWKKKMVCITCGTNEIDWLWSGNIQTYPDNIWAHASPWEEMHPPVTEPGKEQSTF